LNYCNRRLSSVTLSLATGLLFMLIHLLNPQVDLFQSGPTLFFAGSLLTILYFYYKTIWLSIGIHFGNNILQSITEWEMESDILFGNEGYIEAILLAGLFIAFTMKTIYRRPFNN